MDGWRVSRMSFHYSTVIGLTHTHTDARTQIVSATSNERQLEKDVLVGDGGGAPKGCRKTETEQQERCWEPHSVRGCGSVCVCRKDNRETYGT